MLQIKKPLIYKSTGRYDNRGTTHINATQYSYQVITALNMAE